jgi:hypothetical protein
MIRSNALLVAFVVLMSVVFTALTIADAAAIQLPGADSLLPW